VAQKFTVPITVKQLASAGSDAVTVYVDADTQARLKLEAGGRLVWGSGASAGDVNLYRDGVDVLKTDDTFKTPTLFVDNIEIDPTGAVTNDVLVYNGSKFTAASVALGGGGASLTVSDTAPTSPSEGDLWFNSSNARTYVYYDSSWVEVGGSGGVATLDEIGDVTAPSPTTSDVLQWNGTAWVNVAASTVGATNLDGLSDVVITAPEEFQTLEYNGTNWVNTYSSVVSYVRNAEATTLTTGTAVYIFGATGDHATVKRADNNSDATSSKTIGLVGANITASNNGPVITRGYVDGINLSVGYAAGDILWLGENGAFTKTKPTSPDHLVFLGVVVRATNNGIVYVATQNGYELDELHNVSIPSPSPGDFLKYDGSLWVNDQINLGTDTVGNYVSSVTAGTGISVNFAPGEGVGASVSLNATLDDLSNVSVATPNTNDVLTYNGSSWTAASVAAGGSTVTASTTPPSSPETGSIWFDSSTAKTYVYYDSFWVEIGGTSGGAKMYVSLTAPSTPLEGQLWFNSDTAQTFAYYDSSWVEIGAAGMAAIAADAAPASPVTGQIWFNTSTGATYVYYDSYWIEVGAVAANTVFNLVDAKGDLLLGTADNTLARQAVGTNGQLLQANSATSTGVEWFTPTYAPSASPTFTGTVVLPSTTSIGTVSATELGYVDGVTSAIQTQLNAKANTSGPTFTNTPIFGAGVLSATVGSSVTAHRNYATYANGEILDVKLVKESAGPDWQTNAWMLQKTVDVTNQSYIKFNPTNVAIGNGATDVFYADSGGRIRMPYQPAVYAFANAYTALADNATIPFASVGVNRGSHWNTSTSLFTAPVTGSYYVHGQILTPNDTSPCDMRIAINGTKNDAYCGYSVNNGVLNSHKQGHIQGVVSVSAGDTISIKTSGAYTIYGNAGAGHTSLVIFLLG
jgi:hypothetical protein